MCERERESERERVERECVRVREWLIGDSSSDESDTGSIEVDFDCRVERLELRVD